MPNKNRYKTIKLAVFSGLFYAGGLALFDYGDRVDFRLGKFIFDFLFLVVLWGGSPTSILIVQKSKRTSPSH